MARLFVAIRPPDHTLDVLEGLDRPEGRGVRWTTRDQWHVTLRFLGEEDPHRVVDVLSASAAPAGRATIGPRVGSLGTSVIVAPVTGVEALADSIRRMTAALGAPDDGHAFTGHITLARVRRRTTDGLIGAPITATFDVAEVSLVASETHPDGARYTDLAHFPLEPS